MPTVLGVRDIVYLTNSKSFKDKTLKIEGKELTVSQFVHFRTVSRELQCLKSFAVSWTDSDLNRMRYELTELE